MPSTHEQRAERERRIVQLYREVEAARQLLQGTDDSKKVGAELRIIRANAELARLGAPRPAPVQAAEEPPPAPPPPAEPAPTKPRAARARKTPEQPAARRSAKRAE